MRAPTSASIHDWEYIAHLRPATILQSTRKSQDRVEQALIATTLVPLAVSVHELDGMRLGYVVVDGRLPFLNRTLSEAIQVG